MPIQRVRAGELAVGLASVLLGVVTYHNRVELFRQLDESARSPPGDS